MTEVVWKSGKAGGEVADLNVPENGVADPGGPALPVAQSGSESEA